MANGFQEMNKSDRAGGERGNIRQGILFALLLVTAVLGYLYFFTGVIKPREQISEAPPAAAAPVKQPLPPRPDLSGAEQTPPTAPPDNLPVAKVEEKVSPVAAVQPAPAAPVQARPAAAPPARPAVSSKPKPAAAPPARAVAAPVKAQSGKPARAEVKPASGTKAKAPAAPSPATAKSRKEGITKPVSAAAGNIKKTSKPAAQAKQETVKGRYTLLIGDFTTDREAEKARQRVEKLGMTGLSARKSRKTETMVRLFLAEFDSHDAADAELEKLRPHTGSSAFILKENGRYNVYAGSYLHERGAASELKRLGGKGIKLTMKRAKVAVAVSELTAGPFPGMDEARKEAARLKKKGFVARVVKEGE